MSVLYGIQRALLTESAVTHREGLSAGVRTFARYQGGIMFSLFVHRRSVPQPEGKLVKLIQRFFFVMLFAAVACSMLPAQQSNSSPGPDAQTIQLLLQRITQLEARVAQLEGAKQGGALAEAPSAASVQPAGEQIEEASEPMDSDRMDMSKTLLRIRGFGDVTFHGDNQRGQSSSFSLGQLNLFVTSDISEKFKFIGEVVFEAGRDNIFEADVERYLLQYSPSDYFSIAAGRYHSAIGYYNTAYHHSSWLQTTTERPFLFSFEDQGGVLPIHNVGLSATGLIPSGKLGLHYVAEIGNGRSSRHPLTDEPVQNSVDENTNKAFNLAVYAQPESLRGVQFGFSAYHGVRTPAGLPSISETIFDAHAVIARSNFEWLNEAVLIRHAPDGGLRVFQTPGFYTQISRRFGPYRPYFRYQYINGSDAEPVFPEVGLRHGPSVGLRYDASESVALKLQYDYTRFRHQPAVNGLGLQVGFTF